MYISADKIIEIIEAAKACEVQLPEAEQWIHVRDIAATLQKLIDDEVAEMDKMADYFEAQEDERLNQEAVHLEDEEWGRLQMEEAAIEKELLVDFNWPGGL